MNKEFKDTILNLNFVEAIKEKPGWIGCLKSHLKIIQIAKEKNLDYVIVLEDDNVINNKESFNTKLNLIIEFLENNLDKWNIFNAAPVINKQSKFTNKYKYLNEIFYEITHCSATGFIIYNKNVYNFFLEYNRLIKQKQKNTYKIDMIIFNNFKILTTYPIMCKQLNEDLSDIYENIRTDINKIYYLSDFYFRKFLKNN